MKIELQNIHFALGEGGIESYLYSVSKVLLKMGHSPSVFCARHTLDVPAEENIEGIKIIRHKRLNLPGQFKFFNPIYYSIGLQKYIGKRIDEADAFWTRHPYYCYATGKILENRKPLIFIQATPLPRFLKMNYQNSPLLKRIYTLGIMPQVYFVEKKALGLCDTVVTLSQSKKREISDFYKVPTDKFSVIPPGIDTERFKPVVEKNKDLMKKFGLDNSYVVLTVGRLAASKNISMLLRAFSKLKTKNVKLLVAGDGFQKPCLQKLASDLSITKNVVFTGTVREVEKIYNLADIFVCPSVYEGFGHVYLEAMASGVPCIGIKSDYPHTIVATEEIIDDGRTGFIVDRYRIEKMAEQIDVLIDDKNLRRAMGTCARKTCEEKYLWEDSVNKLLDITKRLKVA